MKLAFNKPLKLFFISLALLLTSCAEEQKLTGELTDLLPPQSAVIIKLQDPDLFFSNLKNNEFVKQNLDFDTFEKVSEALSILKHFQKKDPALLTFLNPKEDSIHFAYITKGDLNTVALDSVKNKSIETEKSDLGIKKYDLEGEVAYTASKNGLSILSNSRDLLIHSLENESEIENIEDFEKAFKAAAPNKPAIFINHRRFKNQGLKKWISGLDFSRLSGWTVLDADVSLQAIKLNGITVANDSLPSFIQAFNNTTAVENKVAQITPLDAISLSSFSFDDFNKLNNNLKRLRSTNEEKENSAEELGWLANAIEVGRIELENGSAIVVRSKDPDGTNYQVDPDAKLTENFREIDIFEYPENKSLKNVMSPLLSFEEQRFFAFLEPFFVLSEDPATIKSIITAVKNEQVLTESAAYKAISENLSSAASILVINNNSRLKNVNSEGSSKELNFENFPLSAFQVVNQEGFAHVHAVLGKNSEVRSEANVAQTSAIHLEKGLAISPVFFKNHRSNGNDIAVQDLSNTLYLISSSGKIYWKKQLESRILGEIKTVDILKNGRYQLAFATQSKLHVIDREGNAVKPFPLEFKDLITQPLSVFDYDNNRDYRFIIVQGNRLYMYDRKGKAVRGFNFEKADSEILFPPKHIRIGKKDYILIADASKQLNILSRTGNVRVPVKEKIDFAGNEWYEYNGDFVSTNDAGNIISVDENGKIKKEDKGISGNAHLTATEKTLVTLSENELTIKGNTINLDFGLYTSPRIFYINNKIYVSTTDLQSQKAYLFDSNAEIIPGFPVYGTSAIDLSNADSDPALELAVKGDDDTVLLYEVN